MDGTDVSGLTLAVAADIPGNVLNGAWRVVVFVDEKATSQQQDALLSVFTGKHGGPVAALAQLIGEVVGVERTPISFKVDKGKGTLRIGNDIAADVEVLQGATGETTTLQDTAFSSIPGSPAYVGKAPNYKLRNTALGIDLSLKDHNSVQGHFRFQS